MSTFAVIGQILYVLELSIKSLWTLARRVLTLLLSCKRHFMWGPSYFYFKINQNINIPKFALTFWSFAVQRRDKQQRRTTAYKKSTAERVHLSQARATC